MVASKAVRAGRPLHAIRRWLLALRYSTNCAKMFSELTIAYVWYSSQLSESNLQEFLWRRRPRGAHVFDWRSCLGGRDLKRARASLQPATALLLVPLPFLVPLLFDAFELAFLTLPLLQSII